MFLCHSVSMSATRGASVVPSVPTGWSRMAFSIGSKSSEPTRGGFMGGCGQLLWVWSAVVGVISCCGCGWLLASLPDSSTRSREPGSGSSWLWVSVSSLDLEVCSCTR